MKPLGIALVWLCFLLRVSPLVAQTVSGTVIDGTSGELLIGATVVNTANPSAGAYTDDAGQFTLKLTSAEDTLSVSYFNYITKLVVVAGQTELTIELEPTVGSLDEVVVVGYGSLKKRDNVGNVSKIDGDDITSMPSASFDVALQGKSTGIQVNQSGGVPGGPVRILVRGTNSISVKTEPLVIVDGVPILSSVTGVDGNAGGLPQNPLAAINPDDIESVQVLKDAAATAIYGSRGSNGVILITTKSGRVGQQSTSVSIQAGIGQPVNLLEYATSEEWFGYMDIARENAFQTPIEMDDNLVGTLFFGPGSRDFPLLRSDAEQIQTNWFEEVLRSSSSFQQVNVSSSKGEEKGFYYVSGNYRNELPIYEGSQFERFTFRANLEFSPLSFLKIGTKLSGASIDYDRPLISQGYQSALTGGLPFIPTTDTTGGYWWPLSGLNSTPFLDEQFRTLNTQTYRGLGNFYADISVPFVEGLKLRAEYGFDLNHSIRNDWTSEEIRASGVRAAQNYQTARVINYNLYATYDRNFDNHYFNVVVGTESFRRQNRSIILRGEGDLRTDIQEPGTLNTATFSAGYAGLNDDELFRGYFGRLTYKFRDRYILNGSFRRDGSSRFRAEDRWAVFPAAGFAWLLSDEAFFEDIKPAFSLVKLRGSFGVTGNANLSARRGEVGFLEWPLYAGDDGIVLSNIPAQSLTWETTQTWEVGADLGLFNDRVSASASYFSMFTQDLLLLAPVPPSFGAATYGSTAIWANIGDMQNVGIEVELLTHNINQPNVRWDTRFNFTRTRNEVLQMTQLQDPEAVDGIFVGNGFVSTDVGFPLATFYLPVHAGVDSLGRELVEEVDVETGELTGNVIPLRSQDDVRNNRQLLENKSGLPTYFGGVGSDLYFYGFELNVFVSFQGGNYILDRHEEFVSYMGVGTRPILASVAANPESPDLPRPVWENPAGKTTTDRYLHRGDFLRLRTLQLAYNLPKDVLSRLKMSQARIFLTGANLLTFTPYPGTDPEILNISSDDLVRNLAQGVVTSGMALPQLKTYTIGLNLNF